MQFVYEESKSSYPLRPGWLGIVQLAGLLAIWVGGPLALIWWIFA